MGQGEGTVENNSFAQRRGKKGIRILERGKYVSGDMVPKGVVEQLFPHEGNTSADHHDISGE